LATLALAVFTVCTAPGAWANNLEKVQDWRIALPNTWQPTEQALVQVRNSRLALANNIQFDIQTLHGTVAATQPNTPVSLENLAAYQVNVEHAQLRIADNVLQALVQAELEASEAPLRIKQVTTQTDGILITGDIKRLGLWIPFTMEGTPTVANAGEITLTPRTLKVAGVPLYKALLATNIQLQSLIDMKSKAVALQGQAMVLRLDQVVPAPKLSFELNDVQLGQGEVIVLLGKANPAPLFFAKPIAQSILCTPTVVNCALQAWCWRANPLWSPESAMAVYPLPCTI